VSLLFLRATPVRSKSDRTVHPVRSILNDLSGGFRYMFATPWLLASLLYASVLVLAVLGPIEVLLPFAVKGQVHSEVQAALGGGAGAYAVVLASFGLGGAIGSIFVSSRPLPRRYLTIMVMVWGVGCLPLALIGFTDQLWLIAVAVFIVGFGFSFATVIWGTLLQRRVPPELLGRVSSLDFFVSISLLPVSMAIAGPLGVAIGTPLTFVIAGLVPAVLAVAPVLLARMPRDELAHPLDVRS
jgi:MFS family permease